MNNPEDLLDKTKVYQFMRKTKSRNTIDKLSIIDKKRLDRLLKSITKWMNWHDSQLAESQKSGGKKIKKNAPTELN